MNAWIDSNGDGSWGGVGEKFFDSVRVSTGDNVWLFDVRNWVDDGLTYVLFRLSMSSGNATRELAFEFEDGLVDDGFGEDSSTWVG